MPFRFRRSIRLFPGVRLNLSTRLFSRRPLEGISLTGRAGPLSVNSRTRTPRVDLPGGLHWTGRAHDGRTVQKDQRWADDDRLNVFIVRAVARDESWARVTWIAGMRTGRSEKLTLPLGPYWRKI